MSKLLKNPKTHLIAACIKLFVPELGQKKRGIKLILIKEASEKPSTLTAQQVLREYPTPRSYKTRTGQRPPPQYCCQTSRPCASDPPLELNFTFQSMIFGQIFFLIKFLKREKRMNLMRYEFKMEMGCQREAVKGGEQERGRMRANNSIKVSLRGREMIFQL